MGSDGSVRQIWTASADGSEATTISDVSDGIDPAHNVSSHWSPNGTEIAWVGGTDFASELFVTRADGSERLLVDGSSNIGLERWTPDGTRIVLSEIAASGFELLFVNADGSGYDKHRRGSRHSTQHDGRCAVQQGADRRSRCIDRRPLAPPTYRVTSRER